MIELMDAVTQQKFYLNTQHVLRLKAAQEGLTNIILSIGGLITVVGNVDDIAALINTVLR